MESDSEEIDFEWGLCGKEGSLNKMVFEEQTIILIPLETYYFCYHLK